MKQQFDPIAFRNKIGRCGLGLLASASLLIMLSACAKTPDSSNTTAADDAGEPAASVQDETDTASAASQPDPNHVLYHAVFFKFKDSSTDEQVQQVVDAFRELPSKIPTIVDFQCGVNNSPEGLNDGFTHCFLLAFKDEPGRATYLPHDAHKAFGDVLRPHMDKVFVVDFWGVPLKEKLDKQLRHMVFFKFKDDAAPQDIQAVVDAFAALPEKIDTIKGFTCGVNNSPEKHNDGFTHAFLVTFDSDQGRETYLPHPDHKAFGALLKPVLDKVRVLDFWAEK